jgi:hypothetical protein
VLRHSQEKIIKTKNKKRNSQIYLSINIFTRYGTEEVIGAVDDSIPSDLIIAKSCLISFSNDRILFVGDGFAYAGNKI